MITVKTMGMFSPTISSPGCVCVCVFVADQPSVTLIPAEVLAHQEFTVPAHPTVQFWDVLANHGQIYFVALKSQAAFFHHE